MLSLFFIQLLLSQPQATYYYSAFCENCCSFIDIYCIKAPIRLCMSVSHLHVLTHSGGEIGSSDSANQRPLLLSILSMLLEGRRGCRGTRQGGGGKSWQICGGQGRQGWSCRLFWKLPAAVSAIRIKPVPGGGGGSHCRFLSSQPLPVCLPAEWDDIREGDGGNVPPPHPLLNNSSACLGSLQVCCCSCTASLLMEPAITNTDILTFK